MQAALAVDRLLTCCNLFRAVQASVNNCFIRGSVVRYIHLPKDAVDLEVLHDATRRNHRGEAK